MGLFGSVQAAVGTVSNLVGDTYSGGVDAAQGVLNDITSVSVDLPQIGYKLLGIEVQVGIPPGIMVQLTRFAAAGPERFDELLAKHADRTAARTLIQMIRQADGWMKKLELSGSQCRQVAVDFGLRPGVRLLYTPSSETNLPAIPGWAEAPAAGPAHDFAANRPPTPSEIPDPQ